MVAERINRLTPPVSAGEAVLRLRGVSRFFGEPPNEIDVLHEVDLLNSV